MTVTGPSECTLLVSVDLGGPGARRRLLFLPRATPGGDRGRFQTYIPLPHPPVSLGPVEVLGTLCLLPELCLQLATQHWLGTEAELMASSHLYELGPKS